MIPAGRKVLHHRVTDVSGSPGPLFATQARDVPDSGIGGRKSFPEVDVIELGPGADAVVDVDLTFGVVLKRCPGDGLQRSQAGPADQQDQPDAGLLRLVAEIAPRAGHS